MKQGPLSVLSAAGARKKVHAKTELTEKVTRAPGESLFAQFKLSLFSKGPPPALTRNWTKGLITRHLLMILIFQTKTSASLIVPAVRLLLARSLSLLRQPTLLAGAWVVVFLEYIYACASPKMQKLMSTTFWGRFKWVEVESSELHFVLEKIRVCRVKDPSVFESEICFHLNFGSYANHQVWMRMGLKIYSNWIQMI